MFVDAAESSRPAPITQTPNAFWHDVFATYADEVWRGERRAATLFPQIAPRIDQAIEAGYEDAGLEEVTRAGPTLGSRTIEHERHEARPQERR